LSVGIAFMVGPGLVGIVSSFSSPAAGSILATSLLVTGGLLLAVQRGTAPPPRASGQHRSSKRLLHKRFVGLVGTNVGIGLFFGSMQVSVTAFAVARGTPGLAGPLYSITSLVSLFAGLVYGARRWRTAPETQFVIAFIWLTVSCLPLIVAHTPLTAAVALALPGLAIAPFQTLSAVLAESTVDPAILTEAFTWLNSGGAAGIALGSAFAGWVVDGHSAQYGFVVALAAAVTATMMAVTVRLSGR
jgi:MFS family permease